MRDIDSLVHRCDVAILADFRDRTGLQSDVAAEIRTLAHTGRSVILAHLPLHRPTVIRRFEAGIVKCLVDGAANLALRGDRVICRTLVVHEAHLVAASTVTPPSIDAQEIVVRPTPDGHVQDIDDLRQLIRRRLGPHDSRLSAAPIVPVVTPAQSPATASVPRATGARGILADVSTAAAPADVPVRARLMLLSSNGAGMGHLTRLMAIARRLPAGIETVIATQSHAASVVESAGYLAEYIPSRNYLGIPAPRWNAYLHSRLRNLVATYRPQVVAFDGAVPYQGLLDTMAEHPEVTWVWVRRAMWKAGLGQQWLDRGSAFDRVLEPGEFAASVDPGLTVAARDSARCIDPIVYLDPGELLDRADARQALELDDRPAALLQLGAGNINDITSPVARIAQYLSEHGFHVVLAESPIATRSMPAPAGTTIARLYPVSRYLRGFDLAVSAAGYNSFHELIGFGIPSVFVPNAQTSLDDQIARARHASTTGVGLVIEDPSGADVRGVLDQAIRPEVRAALVERCRALSYGDGAADAAAWLAALCARHGHAFPAGAS